MRIKDFLLLGAILLLCISVRLYGFNNPVSDWHSWRQVDTSAVSRSFAQSGFDILHPRYHDISNVPSGHDNPEGYRFVEFPLYNITQAGLFVIFDTFTLEQWGRLTTILASVLSTVFIYLLVSKYANKTAAFFAVFFYAVLPFNIYYGRTILPDPAMISAVLGSIYFFDQWAEHHKKKESTLKEYALYFLTIIFTAEAFLFKPYAAFFLLPILYSAWMHFKFTFLWKWQFWAFAIISVIPLVWWRLWIQQYPEGIPASDWLFNKDNIRFKGAFFYHLFAERIGRLILGYWGLGIFILGLIRILPTKNMVFFYTFLISSLLYMTVIAGGNVQHDYYQVAVIPSIAIFLGLGADFLMSLHKSKSKYLSFGVLGVCVVFMLAFGWYGVRGYYLFNSTIVQVGQEVEKVIPKDSKVIALSSGVGDTTFLYYTGRQGWASFQNPLPEMIKKGADYLVISDPKKEDLEGFGRDYEVVASTPLYILLKLH